MESKEFWNEIYPEWIVEFKRNGGEVPTEFRKNYLAFKETINKRLRENESLLIKSPSGNPREILSFNHELKVFEHTEKRNHNQSPIPDRDLMRDFYFLFLNKELLLVRNKEGKYLFKKGWGSYKKSLFIEVKFPFFCYLLIFWNKVKQNRLPFGSLFCFIPFESEDLYFSAF